jgi:hypothetical protein
VQKLPLDELFVDIFLIWHLCSLSRHRLSRRGKRLATTRRNVSQKFHHRRFHGEIYSKFEEALEVGVHYATKQMKVLMKVKSEL